MGKVYFNVWFFGVVCNVKCVLIVERLNSENKWF